MASPRPAPQDMRIIVSGFFNEALGIGRAAQLTAEALIHHGFDVIREDLRPFDRGLLTRPHAQFVEHAPTWLIVGNPPEAQIALYTHDPAQWREMYRIGLWHWESDEAPASWAKMTRWFHEVWFSSTFSAEAMAKALRRAGLSSELGKLRVHPLPVPSPGPRPARNAEQPVRALAMFDPRSDFDRKNPQGAIDAWLTAFPTAGPGRLIIKSLAQAAHHPRFLALKAQVDHRPDIELRAETLTRYDTQALIASCDILISLHRGEGFGLPLAEAMALGLTVIATGWSGNMQFMNEQNSWPVPFRLVAANTQYNGPQARWAEPDIEAAARCLRKAIEEEAVRAHLGRQARSDITRLFEIWTRDNLFAQAL